ncbi:MAG: methylmalonyl Co-A mutase-associated GTPase MeaB [Crocinitomicaceae bacterium]|nr:methylmalonyl Co-A mutase-associated GTPase MeaB [Crocinitomicaceae bacterium]
MLVNNTSKSKAIKAAQERIRSNKFIIGDVEDLAREITDGKTEALARGITLIESNKDEDRPLSHELLKAIKEIGNPSSSQRIGVTGIPGVGKSTFIEKLGLDLVNEGHRVAVLAVDPSSKRTGGSILGDKTRMEKLANNNNAFVRPSPAADALGGVARATMEAIILCEAAGYDRIIVETVGVGQSETSVREMVDVFCLLLIGGAGDEVQGIKRGIVEMADLVVVHKADSGNEYICKETASAYRSSIHLFPKPKGEHTVEVLTASSYTGDGHNEFRSKLQGLIDLWIENEYFSTQRSLQQVERMKVHAMEILMSTHMNSSGSQKIWNELKIGVEKGEISAYSAAWSWAKSKK